MHQSSCCDFLTCQYDHVVLFPDQMIWCQQAKVQNPLTCCATLQQRSLLGLFLIHGIRSHFHVSLSGLSIWQFYFNQSLILIRLVACHRTNRLTWGKFWVSNEPSQNWDWTRNNQRNDKNWHLPVFICFIQFLVAVAGLTLLRVAFLCL